MARYIGRYDLSGLKGIKGPKGIEIKKEIKKEKTKIWI